MTFPDSWAQDLRFAFRAVRRRPLPALVAVVTLALGIGANTAVFSVVDAVLLSPPPFRDPERLAVIWASNPEVAVQMGLPDRLPVSPGAFYDWQRESRSFEKMAMLAASRMALTGQGEPEMLGGVVVSGEFFQLLGARPLLGRTLLPEDDAPGERTTAVLSHGLWRRRFGGDPGVLGRKILLNGAPLTVVGVMPAGFAFPRGTEFPSLFSLSREPDLWVPMALPLDRRQTRGYRGQLAIGLLAPGVTVEAARQEMEPIAERIRQAHVEDTGWGVRPEPLAEQLVGDVRPALLILLGAGGLVLLIACANVAHLFLAQAMAHEREVAVRTALGAGRGRLARQLLTESLVIAAVGGALGLLAAFCGLRLFASWIPESLPVPADLSLNGSILLFTLGAVVLAGLLSGLAPVVQTARSDLSALLREGGRGAAGAASSRRARRLLVVTEVALAVLLVLGAGLLIRSFVRLTRLDPGFRAEKVLTLEVRLPGSKYESARRAPFFAAVLERLRGLPGVEAASAVNHLPLSGEESIDEITVEGQPPREPPALADLRTVMPGYFEVLGIARLAGRSLEERDAAGSLQVAVISESMAAAYFPGGEAVGRRFHLGSTPDPADENPWWTVVGVVRDVRHTGLHSEPRPQMYLPAKQFPVSQMVLVVRTAGAPLALADEARAAVYAVDRDQPVSKVRTMEQVLGRSVAGQRFNMILLTVFAGVALVLAAVGIYGITAYSVTQRTREMGLRLALGARRGQVLGLVLREAGMLALAGIAVGLLLGFLATRLMSSLLFGVEATDPATYIAVSLGLGLVVLAAAWVPGRRATAIDPMAALRVE